MASLNDSLSDGRERGEDAGKGVAETSGSNAKGKIIARKEEKGLGSMSSIAGPSTTFGVRWQTRLGITALFN